MLDLISSILVILVLAIGLGEVFNIFNLPEVVGAIIAGIILGPAVFGILQPNQELTAISILALFFIILQIGVEASTDIFSLGIGTMSRFSISVFIVPFLVMTLGSILIFGLSYIQAVSISLSVSIPSISIASVLLIRSQLFKTDDGRRLMGAVAMSDVIAFVILASFHRTIIGIVTIALSLAIFIIAIAFIDNYFKSRSVGLIKRVDPFMGKREGILFAIVIVMGLAVSSLFEYIGITFVLGAFFSGLIIHQNSIGVRAHETLRRTFQRINSSFFIPLFFSISGLEVIRVSFNFVPLLFYLLAITAILGGLAAYLVSKKYLHSISPMSSVGIFGGRGAVGVIIASLVLNKGFINNDYYSTAIMATVIMAVSFSLVFGISMKNRNQH